MPPGQLFRVVEAQDGLNDGHDEELEDQALPQQGVERAEVFRKVEVGHGQVEPLQHRLEHLEVVLHGGSAKFLLKETFLIRCFSIRSHSYQRALD